MVEVWIPYGDTEICADIPAEKYLGSLEPRSPPHPPSPEAVVSEAFQSPLNGLRLSSLVEPRGRAVVLLDEYASTLPLKPLIEEVLRELEEGGLARENVTLLFGRGLEKPYQPGEVSTLLSGVEGCKVTVHNPEDAGLELAEVGSTSRRVKVFLRRDVVEADVKILVGKVSPHPYAGYSGLGQTLLSAAGSLRTLNRNYALYGSLEARAGRLEGNPLYSELLEAARLARLTYAVHVVCSWEGLLLKVFAGSPEETFQAAVAYFEEVYSLPFKGKAQAVLVSPGGKPYDSTLEGALLSLERVVDLVEEGGSIVLASECSGERLNSRFLLWLHEAKTVEKAEKFFKERMEKGFHRVLRLRKLQSKFRIGLVSGLPETIASELLGFKAAKSLDDAVKWALRGLKGGGVVTVPAALKTVLKVEA